MDMGPNQAFDRLLQIEIPLEKIESLFSQGLICAADFRCLNLHSKETVRKLCKQACSKHLLCMPADH